MVWITRAIGSALWMVVFLIPTLQAQEKPTTPLNAQSVTISAATPEDIQQRIHKLDLYIEAACKQWNVPGASVAVVHKDQVLLSKGYGVREAGGNVSVDGDTLFAIASNSKAFTSAALAILVDEKKLRWDDRVQQHLPWFELYDEYVSHEMRISDLLCHRSGLGTFSGDLLWYGTPFTAEEIVQRCKHLKPVGSFRSHFGYSNVMFLAAGLVIEKVSGKPWSEFIQERILAPNEMTRSITSVRDLITKDNFATPHKTLPERSEPIAWVNWDTMAAAGGIISSANDMSKWMRLQLKRGNGPNSRIFSEASSDEMWQAHTPIRISPSASKRIPLTHFRSYGLGWGLADYAGKKLVSHGGGYDGMYSHQILIPEEEFGVIVLTNSMTSLPDSVANRAVDVALGLPERDWSSENLKKYEDGRKEFRKQIEEAIKVRTENTKPSHPLESYTGNFQCPLFGAASVALEDGKLLLRLTSNPDMVADLEHQHYDSFVIRWRSKFAWFDEGSILFVANSRGEFDQLKLDVPNEDLWFYELDFRRVK